MILGIDASFIRNGGGVTHLVEFLCSAHPSDYGFSEVIVWANSAVLSRIEDRSWLVKPYEPLLDRSLPWRVLWQKFRLKELLRLATCAKSLLVLPCVFSASRQL